MVTTILTAIVGWLVVKIHDCKKQQQTLDQIALMTARTVIYSDKFDVDEKIEAYRLYKSKGGNHRTKAYMSNLVGQDIDEYIINHKEAA